jgi:hypothetical protein
VDKLDFAIIDACACSTAPKNFVAYLYELRVIVKDGCSDEDAKKFKKKVDELVAATTNKLNEPRRKRR